MSSGLRRDLGTIESYATLLGILIGAGIFKVTGEAWTLTGPSVILGYLVLAPAILATSVHGFGQSSGAGLTTIELAALWSLLGAILFVANRRTARRIEHAQQP